MVNAPNSMMMSVRTATRIVSSRHGLSAAAASRVTATRRRVALTGATAMKSSVPSIGLVTRAADDAGTASEGNCCPTAFGMGGLRTSNVPSSRSNWMAPAIPMLAAR